eukprot:scaffold1902_cov80-Skeletonema_marinoi.AAC.5
MMFCGVPAHYADGQVAQVTKRMTITINQVQLYGSNWNQLVSTNERTPLIRPLVDGSSRPQDVSQQRQVRNVLSETII